MQAFSACFMKFCLVLNSYIFEMIGHALCRILHLNSFLLFFVIRAGNFLIQLKMTYRPFPIIYEKTGKEQSYFC